jgi:putative spermidine/putrescine transport system substrate-binding protein
MTQGWNGRMFNAIVNENKPFAIVWDHQIWDMGVWSVVKGTRKLDTAMDFISFASQPVRIAEQSRYIPYGPARRSAFSLVSTHIEHNVDMKPHLPTAPENFATALLRDVKFWGNHQEELNEKFFTWLSR